MCSVIAVRWVKALGWLVQKFLNVFGNRSFVLTFLSFFKTILCVCVRPLTIGLWLSYLWGRQPGLLPSGWPCSLQKLQHQSHPGPHCQGHDWPLSNTHIYMQVPNIPAFIKSWETPYPVTSLHTNIYAQTNAHVHIKLSFHLRGHDLSCHSCTSTHCALY